MKSAQIITENQVELRNFNRRIEEAGWAFFLIIIGGLWLVPKGSVPSDLWLVGAGVIMLCVNFVRYFSGIKMSGFTVFLGIVALAAGLSGIINLSFPAVAILFIILGASLLMRALFKG